MNKKVEKFLEFNGKAISFIAKNGTWWIALKPICEALEVNYNRQFQNLKKSKILSQLFAEQQMVAADGKLRKMVSLPEFVIYGWIFNIESNAEGMVDYQWECYQILYEHFHGAIGGRKDLLKVKAKAQVEIDRVYNGFTPDQALSVQKAKKIINQVNSKLRQLDAEALREERDLFSTI